MNKEKIFFQKGAKSHLKLPKTYMSKPMVLDMYGNGVWPELATLAKFQSEGYEGLWVDAFHKKFWQNKNAKIEFDFLPKKIKEVMGRGCWDLIIWKNNTIKFVELKGIPSKDKIRKNQLEFMRRLLESGFKDEDFLVVEWDYKK